jgi:hypothetical protein
MRLTANHLAVVFLRARVAYPCRVMTHPVAGLLLLGDSGC